ncbi:MAG: hypothetical protein U0W40_16035 [Acidimicrobiia bacterium]
MTSPALTDAAALQQFQMHGQDIPTLLAHWAEQKADHPALVWSPRGRRPPLDLGRAAHRRAPLSVGLAAQGSRRATRS